MLTMADVIFTCIFFSLVLLLVRSLSFLLFMDSFFFIPYDPRMVVVALCYCYAIVFHAEYRKTFQVFGEGRSKMADFYALITTYCVYSTRLAYIFC